MAGEVPAVGRMRWVEMSEDDQCVLELRFAASVIRWLVAANPTGVSVFHVDMTDVEERQALLDAAREAGVEVCRDAAGTLSGRIVPTIAGALVTCTQSVLSVKTGDSVVCEVVDYLDDMRMYVTRDELVSLGNALRDADVLRDPD